MLIMKMECTSKEKEMTTSRIHISKHHQFTMGLDEVCLKENDIRTLINSRTWTVDICRTICQHTAWLYMLVSNTEEVDRNISSITLGTR
jgi:hypothetical protein